MFESKTNIDKSVILYDNFESNSNSVSIWAEDFWTVSYSNWKLTTTWTNTGIKYCPQVSSNRVSWLWINIKFTPTKITSADQIANYVWWAWDNRVRVLTINSSWYLVFKIYQDWVNSVTCSSDNIVVSWTEYIVQARRDWSIMYMMINWVLQTSQPTQTALVQWKNNQINLWWLVLYWASESEFEYFSIYNRSLSENEAMNLYYNKTYKNIWMSNKTLDIDTIQWYINNRLWCTYTNSNVEIKRPNNYYSWYYWANAWLTIENSAWKVIWDTNNTISIRFNKISLTWASQFIFSMPETNNNRIYIWYEDDNALDITIWAIKNTVQTISLWERYNVVVTIDRTNLIYNCFINWVNKVSDIAFTYTSSFIDFYIWKQSASNQYFNWYIWRTQIRKKLLTDNEIMQIYTSEKHLYWK